MNPIGFSTGALAFGDFLRGVELQRTHAIDAIELSALREHELPELIASLSMLDLSQFHFRSFHAPSSLQRLTSAQLAETLQSVVALGFPVVIHPDIIQDFGPWRELGRSVLLENMDIRKPVCRTAREMAPFFSMLPEAMFCFDIGHAHQVDPTMSVAVELMLRFADRMAEVHISEVTWDCKHVGISTATAISFHEVARLIPESMPVIVESVIASDQIDRELDTVRRCLNSAEPYAPFRRSAVVA